MAATSGAKIRLPVLDALAETSSSVPPCDAVAFDQRAVQRQVAAVERCSLIRPGVFLLYYECLVAARHDDLDALAPSLQRLSTASIQAAPFVVRGFGDASLSAPEWSRYQRALLAEPDISVEVGPVPQPIFDTASDQLAWARRAVAAADPALAAEIEELINELVFATDRRGAGLSQRAT